jgi:uncharacterized membrane protein YidH (DUF202 family)
MNRPASHEVTDDGLQQERTALAWNRTALALIIAGALYLRAGGPLPALVPGVLVIALGAFLLVKAGGRYRRLRKTGFLANRRLYFVVAAGATAFSLAAALHIVITATLSGP